MVPQSDVGLFDRVSNPEGFGSGASGLGWRPESDVGLFGRGFLFFVFFGWDLRATWVSLVGSPNSPVACGALDAPSALSNSRTFTSEKCVGVTSYLRLIDSCITQLKAQGPVTRVKKKKKKLGPEGDVGLFGRISKEPRGVLHGRRALCTWHARHARFFAQILLGILIHRLKKTCLSVFRVE